MSRILITCLGIKRQNAIKTKRPEYFLNFSDAKIRTNWIIDETIYI